MVEKRIRKVNPELAALLRSALVDAEMTIDELGAATRLKRNAGALIRGEVGRPSPEQVKALTDPDSLDNVFEFTGAEGALADPWGVGTIGNLDMAGKVQFGTVYDNKSGVTHTGLEQSSGDGWVCYRSVP